MVISSLYFTGVGEGDTTPAAMTVFALLFITLFTYIIAITWAQCCMPSQPETEEGDGQEQAVEGNGGERQGWLSRVSLMFRRKLHAVEETELQETGCQIDGLELPEAPLQPGRNTAQSAIVVEPECQSSDSDDSVECDGLRHLSTVSMATLEAATSKTVSRTSVHDLR